MTVGGAYEINTLVVQMLATPTRNHRIDTHNRSSGIRSTMVKHLLTTSS
jgi:hypothetical protein